MTRKQPITGSFFSDAEEVAAAGGGNSVSVFAAKLLDWYDTHHRKLPWRATADPYRIWLSEVILQQTRVAQGLPYYEKFVSRYPDVAALAAAPERDVLHLWQGLGYYSRARNMLHTAVEIAKTGCFPSTYRDLVKLKGIGDYTASAIASFAFGEQVAVVDGNVFRVLARYLGIEEDISGANARDIFKEASYLLMPPGGAAGFNQALMEFGALQCVPVSPDCGRCVVRDSCYAFRHKKQATLPVKIRKTRVQNRYIHYLVLLQDNKMALRERKGKDIWEGLYDFPSVETDGPEENTGVVEALAAGLLGSAKLHFSKGPVKHVLSHQRIFAMFWIARVPGGSRPDLPADTQFYEPEKVPGLPMPVLISTYLRNFFVPL